MIPLPDDRTPVVLIAQRGEFAHGFADVLGITRRSWRWVTPSSPVRSVLGLPRGNRVAVDLRCHPESFTTDLRWELTQRGYRIFRVDDWVGPRAQVDRIQEIRAALGLPPPG